MISKTAFQPSFRSLAIRECPDPDYLDVIAVPLPGDATDDARTWARHLFSPASMPRWVVFLMGLRQVAVRFVGIPVAQDDVFRVCEVVGQEALIASSDKHLDFWAAVGVDPDAELLRLTTVVKLHNFRGRLYWAVVRPLHPLVVAGMLRRAVARPPRPVPDRSRA